jgi:proteasome lid subunit RPN8/RPN11
MELRISRQHLEQLHFWAEKAHPKEACGLLWGGESTVNLVELTRNVAPNPLGGFEIDPVALLNASRRAREQTQQVIGCFHSHPNGLAEPSLTDAQWAAGDGRFWLIIAKGAVTAWHAVEGGNHLDRFMTVQIVTGDA